MTNTDIFAGDDPFAIIRRWQAEAWETEPNDANAISLATVDAAGMPNVRVVLLKEIEDDAFVFYTNYESAKGRELATQPKAAFVLHWKSLRRQIRVRGDVEREDGPQADAYYNTRALESRIGAWASAQSQPLKSREQLMERVAKFREEKGDAPARPPYWGGFRIRPVEIELWSDGDFRLHDRFQWTRVDSSSAWKPQRLSP
ncbi:MAG: pyridoxamine 5'-phosphate oxidase [Pseudomonadota bacterium]